MGPWSGEQQYFRTVGENILKGYRERMDRENQERVMCIYQWKVQER